MAKKRKGRKAEGPVSKAQAGFYGAVAGGASTTNTDLTPAEAKKKLRGKKVKNLPRRK